MKQKKQCLENMDNLLLYYGKIINKLNISKSKMKRKMNFIISL